MTYDDDDDYPELTDLLPLRFTSLHEDLRRARYANLTYLDLLLFDDGQEVEP